jgi:hypothetical protein
MKSQLIDRSVVHYALKFGTAHFKLKKIAVPLYTMMAFRGEEV